MPFDGIGKLSLTDYLAAIGITPVRMADLEAHKRAQLRRHPGNPMLTWVPYALVAIGISAWFIASNPIDMFPLGVILGGGAAAVLFCFTNILCIICEIRMRKPARWVETSRPLAVPPEICAVINCLRDTMPRDATLIYGELRQDKTVLDPYLLIRRPGETQCLGIWDGKTIIAVATID